MRNNLKLPETSWNRPETTWIHRKPVTLYHFLVKTGYFQVTFALILNCNVFWVKFDPKKLSSPNWLKFSTGGALLGLLLLGFQCLYFQKFWHCFQGKFGPIIWISSNWLKLGTGVNCCMLIRILSFLSKVCYSYNFEQMWSQNLMSSKILRAYFIQKLLFSIFTEI